MSTSSASGSIKLGYMLVGSRVMDSASFTICIFESVQRAGLERSEELSGKDVWLDSDSARIPGVERR